MCELLVIAQDRTNTDLYLDAQCYKVGDVVTVCPDGHPWGSGELSNPIFRILKLPGIPVADATVFMQPEVNIDPLQPSYVLQRRIHRLDISGLPAFARNLMAASRRTVPTMRVPLSLPALVALKIKKPRLTDPGVFT